VTTGGPPGRLLAGGATVVLGAVIALQSRVNGELSQHVGSGLFPAWWTMTTGFVLLTLIVASRPSLRRGLATAVAGARSGALPWWVFTGGAFGSVFLVTQSLAVPIVGVAVFTVGVVAGQTTGSLIVDRLGLTGTGRRAVTVNRVAAAVLAIAAVGVGVSDRLQSAGGVAGLALLAVLAGALLAPQQAFNGRVGLAAGSPFAGAWGNFVVGAVLMSVVLLVALGTGLQLDGAWTAAPWAYVGGVLGFSVILGGAWAVPVLGVLVYSLLSLFGQLAGALLLDLVAPTSGTSVGWHLFAGVGMTAVAVLVASARGRAR
jgi:transporter family-2 protein